MRTTVVHCKKEAYDIYIGRPSKWGNPLRLGVDGNRTEVIHKYRAYILNEPRLLNSLQELRGLRLGCYCKPALCHGDVLAELADIPTGPAIWKSSEADLPVDITGVMGMGSDGRIYLRTVYGSGVPMDEIVWPEANHG
jgi:hypothetical protein